MIGIIVGLLISWLLLKFTLKTGLGELAQGSVAHQLVLLGMGMLFSAILCSCLMLWKVFAYSETLALNPNMTPTLILEGVWWTVKSVAFEELLFRGALLVLAMRWLGTRAGVIFSACCFGVYHWFTFGGLGNPVLMTYIFLLTGLMGLVWAHSFALSRSLFLPIGFHLGWNLVSVVGFSTASIGPQILIQSGGAQPAGVLNILDLLIKLIVPPALTWAALRLAKKNSLFSDSEVPS